jgi:hypothetical protein
VDTIISYIGSVASVLGVFISIYLLWALKRIKNHFLLKVRIPELIDSLSDYANNLSNALQKHDQKIKEIEEILNKCEPVLKNLHLKVSGLAKRETKTLLKKMKKRKKPVNKDAAYDLYDNIQALIQTLKELKKDINWS